MIRAQLEQRIAELLNKPYRKVIRGDTEEGFLGEAPELPGCLTAGETEAETIENLREAMAAWFEAALIAGRPIPEPSGPSAARYGGRVLLWMPSTLHRRLAERADEEGVSLNQMAVTVLAQSLGHSGH
jgi:predicted RNase H-like HicB family nuclease